MGTGSITTIRQEVQNTDTNIMVRQSREQCTIESETLITTKMKRLHNNNNKDTQSEEDESVTSEEEEPLHDKLESCTVDQLRALQKKALQFDQARYGQKHGVDRVTEEIRGMGQRATIRFDAPLPKLSPQQIVSCFDSFLDGPPEQRSKQPLLLNMERHSAYHHRLLKWTQYEVNGDFFDYIHLALFDQTGKRPPPPIITPDTGGINTMAQLQSALIYSHHQATPFRSALLIERLEGYVNSKLMEIYINRRTASFLFELNDTSPFILVVCFGLIFVPSRGGGDYENQQQQVEVDIIGDQYKYWGDELVSLTRDDLFNDAINLDDIDGTAGGGRNTILTKRKKFRLLEELERQERGDDEDDTDGSATATNMNQRREYLRLSKLSYLYYGYMGRS